MWRFTQASRRLSELMCAHCCIDCTELIIMNEWMNGWSSDDKVEGLWFRPWLGLPWTMNFNLSFESIRGSYILLVKWRQIFQQWYIWHLCKTSKGVASISSCHTCVDASDVMEELLNANDWESIAGNTFCYLILHLNHHHLHNHKDDYIKHTAFFF